VRPIPVDNGPVSIAIAPNGETAYVYNFYGEAVTPITLAPKGRHADQRPHSLRSAVRRRRAPGAGHHPDGKTAYVPTPQ